MNSSSCSYSTVSLTDVDLDRAQLAALAAVVGTGSFDAAARQLHVTPSAVSQRVKALEQRCGQVLVRRARPCVATDAGQVLVRLAHQVVLLETEAMRTVGPAGRGAGRVVLPVAVNADSLATWFCDALVGLPDDVVLDVRREDQDHSSRLLRSGEVMAAVTAEGRAVQGCRSVPLGSMRYLGVAAPGFVERRLADGTDGLASAPFVSFDRKDSLQRRFLREVLGGRAHGPEHFVPSSRAFLEAVRAGLGWGMVFDRDAADDLRTGRLVELAPGRHLDVPLHWQHWRLDAPSLVDLTERVVRAAGAALHAPSPRH